MYLRTGNIIKIEDLKFCSFQKGERSNTRVVESWRYCIKNFKRQEYKDYQKNSCGHKECEFPREDYLDSLILVTSSISKEHAIKIAAEYRQKVLRYLNELK